MVVSSNLGFSYLKDEFKDWGLELVDQVENIVLRDSRVLIIFSNFNNIFIKFWLFDKDNKQIGNFCSVEIVEYKITITCQLLDIGMFKLNVFGINLLIDSIK